MPNPSLEHFWTAEQAKKIITRYRLPISIKEWVESPKWIPCPRSSCKFIFSSYAQWRRHQLSACKEPCIRRWNTSPYQLEMDEPLPKLPTSILFIGISFLETNKYSKMDDDDEDDDENLIIQEQLKKENEELRSNHKKIKDLVEMYRKQIIIKDEELRIIQNIVSRETLTFDEFEILLLPVLKISPILEPYLIDGNKIPVFKYAFLWDIDNLAALKHKFVTIFTRPRHLDPHPDYLFYIRIAGAMLNNHIWKECFLPRRHFLWTIYKSQIQQKTWETSAF